MSEDNVGPGRIAEALGVSERQVYRYHQMGMPKAGRGQYPLLRCCIWFRRHILAPAENGNAPDLDEARLRKERAKAREAERRLSRRRQEVMPAEVIQNVTREANGWIRETVLKRAPEIAEALEGVEGPRKAEVALKGEVRELLEELQQGPPEWSDRDESQQEAAA